MKLPPEILRCIVSGALGHDLRTTAAVARAGGFAGVLLAPSVGKDDLTGLSVTGQREVRHLFAASGQRIVGIGASIAPAGFAAAADIDQQLDGLERLLATVVKLGSRLLCLDLGRLPAPPRVRKARPRITPGQAGIILLPDAIAAHAIAAHARTDDRATGDDRSDDPAHGHPQADDPSAPPGQPAGQAAAQTAAIDLLNRALAELAAAADRYGVFIAFSSQLASLAALFRAIDYAGVPWFGLDLDPTALLRDGRTAEDLLNTLARPPLHVRGRDALLGEAGRTTPTPIGTGDVNWPTLLQQLQEASYAGCLTMESVERNQSRVES